MKKQKKQNMLTAIIIILVLILIMMIVSIVYEEKINMSKQVSQNTVQQEVEEEQTVDNEEISVEEEIEEEQIEEKQEYVGEEEKESNITEEVPTKSNDEKAIELAQEEWGEDDSVTFTVENKKDTIYYVAVKSEATVLQWYEVDTETWEINEYY